jgi:hypothetical protein
MCTTKFNRAMFDQVTAVNLRDVVFTHNVVRPKLMT